MKRIVTPFVTLILLIFFGNITSSAASVKVGDLYYQLDQSNKTASVIYQSSSSKNQYDFSTIIIPSEIEYEDSKYLVTSIGKNAFSFCSNLMSVDIPESVSSIGESAFAYSGLKDLKIEDSDQPLAMESGTFFHCPIETLYLGRNLPKYREFEDLTELKTVVIGDCVTSIPEGTFMGCSSLTSVVIPNSLTAIQRFTFNDCSALESITIPNSVNYIDDYAFGNCTGLKELIIEDGEEPISFIGDLFYNCTFESLYLGRNLSYAYNRVPFKNKSTLKYVAFGAHFDSVEDNCFAGSAISSIETYSYKIDGIENSGLKHDVPLTLKTNSDFTGIGETNLTYFKHIMLQTDGHDYAIVTSPADLNFKDCLLSEGDKYILPVESNRAQSNKWVGCVFRGKEITGQLKSEDGFTFEPSVYHAENVFRLYGDRENSDLTREVALESAGTLFDKVGLQNIEKVETLKITGDINGTDVMAINRMTGLKYLDISDAHIVEGGVTYRDDLKTKANTVGSYFFNDSNIEVVLLPNTAKTIESSAFENNENIIYVTIPESVTSLGDYAFYYCSNLKSINIGNSVKAIGYYAFAGCSELDFAEIGKSVTSIGQSSFLKCAELKSISIPRSVTSIGIDAFKGCSALKNVVIEDGKSKLTISYYFTSSSKYGMFYDCPVETLYLGRDLTYAYSPFINKSKLKSVVIGDYVTEVGNEAFSGCGNLASVEIGNSVTTIGSRAFCNCKSLKYVKLPESVTNINHGAFTYSGLISVAIPASVKYIREELFWGCCDLTSVEMPDSISSIEDYAFFGCSSLDSMEIPSSVTSIGKYAFSGCSGMNAVIIPDSVCSIDHSAFEGCVSLVSAKIPKSITYIQSSLFSGCSNLESIEIPDDVTTISYDAFKGTKLNEVVIPKSVTYIGDRAFGENQNISKVISLNPTPPNLNSSAFDAQVKEAAKLCVPKGALVYTGPRGQAQLSKGVYVVRQGSLVRKIIVK